MSADFLLKVASVLETMADQAETQAAVKTAAVREERESRVRELADRYNAVTGEDLDVAKLAGFSEEALETVKHLVEKTAGAADVENMGGPGEVPASRPVPQNRKEAAELANDSFAKWILS